MKFFKLVKSIDYVTYPTYKELVKIGDTVSNTIASFKNVLISAIVGVFFNHTPLSAKVLELIREKNPQGIIQQIVSWNGITIYLSVIVAATIYGVICLKHFLHTRWASNKNTKAKRDVIEYEFYNVAIPQLVEIKSILEQIDEDTSNEERKKILLLLQAKHEVRDLYRQVSTMRIIEKKAGVQTEESIILHHRISKGAYKIFLEEMLTIMSVIFQRLSLIDDADIKEEIKDIRADINKEDVFGQIDELRQLHSEIKDRCNGKSKNNQEKQ